jgi:hypothetical protein
MGEASGGVVQMRRRRIGVRGYQAWCLKKSGKVKFSETQTDFQDLETFGRCLIPSSLLLGGNRLFGPE